MDLKQLEYFVVVVEKGSFSRAAAALNLAQPSISRQVALLEQELGQRLLERTGRGVTPTQAGHALQAHARVMLNAAAQALFEIKEMSDEPAGKVVVGLPNRVASGLCVPLVREFRERLPNAMLSVVEGLSLSLREGLLAGRIDVGVLFDLWDQTGLVSILVVPEFLWELSLGIYLAVKGFRPSPVFA